MIQTFIVSLEIETYLCCCTVVATSVTFIDIFTAPAVLIHIISRWTDTGERAGSVYTFVLTQKLREAALIQVNAISTVRRQLKSLVTVAHKGAVGVEAAVSARLIFTLVHVLTGPAVWVEDEPGVAGAGVRARHVGTQLLAVTIATFINILTLSANEPVSFSAGAGVATWCIDADLSGVTVMRVCLTFIDVITGAILC